MTPDGPKLKTPVSPPRRRHGLLSPRGCVSPKKESLHQRCRLSYNPSEDLPDALAPNALSEQRQESHDPSEIRKNDVLHHGGTSGYVFLLPTVERPPFTLFWTVAFGFLLWQARGHCARRVHKIPNSFSFNKLTPCASWMRRVVPQHSHLEL